MAKVSFRDSALMYASISTLCVSASCTMAGIKPCASNFRFLVDTVSIPFTSPPAQDGQVIPHQPVDSLDQGYSTYHRETATPPVRHLLYPLLRLPQNGLEFQPHLKRSLAQIQPPRPRASVPGHNRPACRLHPCW